MNAETTVGQLRNVCLNFRGRLSLGAGQEGTRWSGVERSKWSLSSGLTFRFVMAVRVSVFLWVYVSVSVRVCVPVYWLPAVDLSAAITVDLECFFAIFPLVIVVLALVVVVAVGTYSHVQLIAFNLLDFISVFRRLLCFLPFCCPCPAAPAACLSAISYSLSRLVPLAFGHDFDFDFDFSRYQSLQLQLECAI